MLKKEKKQILYRFRTQTFRYAEISQESSIKPRQAIAKSVAFCSFVPLQRKTQCLRQNLVAKVLWHIKSRYFPNAPSQSPEFSGAEFGNQNAEFHWRLWHLKSHTLPKAVRQSLRIQLALNSLIRTPVPLAETHTKAETGKIPPLA